MKPLTELEQSMYAWIVDYLPQQDAIDLARICAYEARVHARNKVILGISIGLLGTLLLVKWLS